MDTPAEGFTAGSGVTNAAMEENWRKSTQARSRQGKKEPQRVSESFARARYNDRESEDVALMKNQRNRDVGSIVAHGLRQ